jgi:soluble lytic murein transglycosylase-like protein
LLTKAFSILFILYPLLVIAFCFDEAAREYGINPNLLRSIARIESNNNPSAVNHNSNGSSDVGIMQINSSWIKTMGLEYQELLKNPCYNVMIGAKILKKCMDKHGYTWEAIGCYNAVNPYMRVKYSWRIFGELNRRSYSNSDTSPSTVKNTFFHFEVRDINEVGQ